jgi:predicted lipoprotein
VSAYESTLIAYGISPEQAARDSWADQLLAFRNRELAAYGRQYEVEQIADAGPTTDYYEDEANQ